MKFLYPDIYTKSIHTVPYNKLLNKGITALIFDIDNTLVPFDIPHAPEVIVSFLRGLEAQGFKICLLSNNNQQRVELFNEGLSYPAIHKAGKPRLAGINLAIELLDASPDQTAIIGDQIFTDVWCGNRKGITTILTRPVATRDEFTVKLKRGIERVVVKCFVKHAKKQKATHY